MVNGANLAPLTGGLLSVSEVGVTGTQSGFRTAWMATQRVGCPVFYLTDMGS